VTVITSFVRQVCMTPTGVGAGLQSLAALSGAVVRFHLAHVSARSTLYANIFVNHTRYAIFSVFVELLSTSCLRILEHESQVLLRFHSRLPRTTTYAKPKYADPTRKLKEGRNRQAGRCTSERPA
jgi:hypothetical protein